MSGSSVSNVPQLDVVSGTGDEEMHPRMSARTRLSDGYLYSAAQSRHMVRLGSSPAGDGNGDAVDPRTKPTTRSIRRAPERQHLEQSTHLGTLSRSQGGGGNTPHWPQTGLRASGPARARDVKAGSCSASPQSRTHTSTPTHHAHHRSRTTREGRGIMTGMSPTERASDGGGDRQVAAALCGRA